MTPVTLCIAESHGQVERIVERLQAANINEILVLMHHAGATAGDVQIQPITGLTQLNSAPIKSTTASGALTGAAVGGITAAAGLVIPFAWPIVFVALPLTTAMGAALGAVAGAAVGATTRREEVVAAKEFGIPEARLPEYHRYLDAGGYLVAVHAPENSTVAKDIFEELGAQHIDTFG